MISRHYTKIVHEGYYVAKVDVELVCADEGWSPYLSLKDAYRLDDVREALKRGDLKAASKLGRIYKVTRVAGRQRDVTQLEGTLGRTLWRNKPGRSELRQDLRVDEKPRKIPK